MSTPDSQPSPRGLRRPLTDEEALAAYAAGDDHASDSWARVVAAEVIRRPADGRETA